MLSTHTHSLEAVLGLEELGVCDDNLIARHDHGEVVRNVVRS